MNREELIEKIERQRYFVDVVDAYRIAHVYTDLFGVEYNDRLSIEDELIYMYEKIKKYDGLKVVYRPDATKKCTLCKEVKLLDDFHINKNITNGRKSRCKICSNKDYAKYRDNTLKEELLKKSTELELLLEEGKKPCSICKEVKTLDAFHTSTYTKSGRVSSCKDCRIETYNLKKKNRR